MATQVGEFQPDVLVVENDTAVRDSIAFRLRDVGCVVSVASNGSSGLRLLQANRPAVLILDWRLPEIDGANVIRELRASPSGRNLPVILVGADPSALPASLFRDCAAILPKPLVAADLVNEVFRAFVSESVMTASTCAPGHPTHLTGFRTDGRGRRAMYRHRTVDAVLPAAPSGGGGGTPLHV